MPLTITYKTNISAASAGNNIALVTFNMVKSVIRSTLFLSIFVGSQIFAQTEDSYQSSLKKISQEINELSKNLNSNKSKLESEQTQLLKAEKELYSINKRLEEARLGADAAREQVERLNETEKQLLEQQSKSRKALAELIRSNYKNGTPSQLKMVLNQENPYAVGRLNNYQYYFSEAITQKFSQLQTQVQATKDLRAEQKRRATELQSLEQEQEFLKRSREQQYQQRKSAVAKLNVKVAETQTKLKKLKADRSRLNSLLVNLQKQKAELERVERARQEAERLAAEKAKKEGSKPPKKVVRKPVKGGFIKQKGRLTCPVSATAKTKFGQRLVASGMRSEGMFYDTGDSVEVASIFRGQVLFADFLKGFGLLLIVDHGDDHISLYGHNKVLYKKVGDSVETNEVISMTGTTGGLKSHGLYFEIRNNTTPIDPKKWCQ